MKKYVIALVLILFSLNSYAQLSKAYQAVEEKVTTFVDGKKDVCPVYADTPMSKVIRQPWEIEVGFNLGILPSNGPPQFRSDSLSLELVHNMSNAFGVYLRYDTIKYEKYDYENSTYAPEWDNYSITGGAHLYLTPVLRVFGGFGKIMAKDEEGKEPDLGSAVEKGIKYDIPLGDYKIVLVYKIVEASLNSEDPEIEEATGEQNYSIIGVTLSIPFGYE